MGYLHINNLYKDQRILMFKECYALEKIHGTSAHISWNAENKQIKFFSGGANHADFKQLFDIDLQKNFASLFPDSSVVIYGEAYGGKQQRMSGTYGKSLKFVAFDVKIFNYWLSVLNADDVCQKLNIEFVDYKKISTSLEEIDGERDKQSTQAIRNGCGEGKLREGVVLRPLIEFTLNNGERVIVKHKRKEFMETKTPREVNAEELKVLEDATAIADEWVTEMRLEHVLDKLPQDLKISDIKLVINAMVEDIYREAEGEIGFSPLPDMNKELVKSIGNRTALLFKRKLNTNQ